MTNFEGFFVERLFAAFEAVEDYPGESSYEEYRGVLSALGYGDDAHLTMRRMDRADYITAHQTNTDPQVFIRRHGANGVTYHRATWDRILEILADKTEEITV